MAEPSATASIDIAAPPQRVYALLTDLDSFTDIAAETERMQLRSGSSMTVGAVFAGSNNNGKRRWTTKCKVTDAQPSVRFAFNVSHTGVPVSRWQYDIDSTSAGCRVTESTWDRRPWWFKKPAEFWTASPNRPAINQRNIEATLERLKARAES
jgi:uncharacterized protein YndB with AHSA1/START domain